MLDIFGGAGENVNFYLNNEIIIIINEKRSIKIFF